MSDLDKLQEISAALVRLRTMKSDVLQAAGIEPLIDQLEETLVHMRAARETRNQLVSVHAGFLGLLELLDHGHGHPVNSGQLACLIVPLVDQLNQQTEELESVLG